ncbi:MAG: GspH/FimT family pseudopilin [Nitrosomonadales bacterium]|nr:GspH/FimT family pseudopilin [Nitrosomonadales bacterium]
MNASAKSQASGFSLIELMIGLVIMGIILAAAAPNMHKWILNSQIRNAAESIQNGMQQARAQAIARNTNVEFVLSAVAVNDQTSWVIEEVGGTPFDRRLSSEGSQSVKRTILPAGTTTITFDNTGRPLAVNPTGATPRITSITLDSTVLGTADSNDLSVTVDFSGSIKMCDPNASYPNPRAC